MAGAVRTAGIQNVHPTAPGVLQPDRRRDHLILRGRRQLHRPHRHHAPDSAACQREDDRTGTSASSQWIFPIVPIGRTKSEFG
jgi:hypothetical protein